MPLTVVRHESAHLYAREPKTAGGKKAVAALLRLQHAEEYEVEHARIASGLNRNEFQALRYLLQAQRDGRAMGPKDLAVMLHVSTASVTKIVDSLVNKGELRRIPHPTDRRATILEPIDGASEKINNAYARFHQVIVEIIDTLPEQDNELLAARIEQVASALIEDNPALEQSVSPPQ
ncbi:MarR family transcriptional regulator [Curtobacterium sp. MCSS17_005]|uniref:MarR family winged helix-turn-helix transcriptional regulator n=1 Tax=Curtobacterium sp. MCSS17_005 TaxID=2175641 RepID=UPI000DA70D2B|nr:MarR family transcriptional regulator [Curtobacterium sp. MCSS17_005]WIB34353.1 MarR family transcriptional regulator [Curtobacterium sp. MCSS17_005]